MHEAIFYALSAAANCCAQIDSHVQVAPFLGYLVGWSIIWPWLCGEVFGTDGAEKTAGVMAIAQGYLRNFEARASRPIQLSTLQK